jgi:hypothetical protein
MIVTSNRFDSLWSCDPPVWFYGHDPHTYSANQDLSAVLRIRNVLSRIPDPTIAPSRIRIPDPGGKKAPDPGSDLSLYKGY